MTPAFAFLFLSLSFAVFGCVLLAGYLLVR